MAHSQNYYLKTL